jgi:hypothetical protein
MAAVTSTTAGTPTGTIQFYDGTTMLGAAATLRQAGYFVSLMF